MRLFNSESLLNRNCRAAFAIALSEGSKRIIGVAIVGKSQRQRPYICGQCRQIMEEFGNFPVVLSNDRKTLTTTTKRSAKPYNAIIIRSVGIRYHECQ